MFTLAISLTLQGCVAVPFPHKQTVVPSLYGKVVDKNDGQPLQKVSVQVDTFPESLVLTTDNGLFSTLPVRRWKYFLLIPLLPCDRFWGGDLIYTRSDYKEKREHVFVRNGCFTEYDKDSVHVVEMERKPKALLHYLEPAAGTRKENADVVRNKNE